jgi:hypothetical protein
VGGQAPPPRHGHVMACHNDAVYMFGGQDELGAVSTQVRGTGRAEVARCDGCANCWAHITLLHQSAKQLQPAEVARLTPIPAPPPWLQLYKMALPRLASAGSPGSTARMTPQGTSRTTAMESSRAVHSQASTHRPEAAGDGGAGDGMTGHLLYSSIRSCSGACNHLPHLPDASGC